jgi:malate synthase
MAEMLERKITHPKTGGNTAWVPAPYPSDLHSMHYHMVDVDLVQRVMEDSPALNVPRKSLLTFPLLDWSKVSDETTKNNLIQRYVHSMLAYAEPWINRGIGCSGVRNFDDIEEMKDRATERIDGAILANWRLHGVINQADIEKAVIQVAEIVDRRSIIFGERLRGTSSFQKSQIHKIIRYGQLGLDNSVRIGQCRARKP